MFERPCGRMNGLTGLPVDESEEETSLRTFKVVIGLLLAIRFILVFDHSIILVKKKISSDFSDFLIMLTSFNRTTKRCIYIAQKAIQKLFTFEKLQQINQIIHKAAKFGDELQMFELQALQRTDCTNLSDIV